MKFGNHIRKVLIIDDDPIFTEVLRAFFVSRGAETVVTAADGHQAKSVLAEHSSSLDFMTSDLNMPEFDGVEFLMHLNNKEVKVPLVLISSAPKHIVDAASKLAQAYGLNYLGTLSKPLKSQDLEALIQPVIAS